MDDEKKKPPAHELKVGAVKCAIWEREGKNGTWFEASSVRLWKHEEKGEWRDSTSFRDRNLEDLAKAVAEAHNWILATQGSE